MALAKRYTKVKANKEKNFFFANLLDVVCNEIGIEEEELFTSTKSEKKKVSLSIITNILKSDGYTYDKISALMAFRTKSIISRYNTFSGLLQPNISKRNFVDIKYIKSFEKIKNKIQII